MAIQTLLLNLKMHGGQSENMSVFFFFFFQIPEKLTCQSYVAFIQQQCSDPCLCYLLKLGLSAFVKYVI